MPQKPEPLTLTELLVGARDVAGNLVVYCNSALLCDDQGNCPAAAEIRAAIEPHINALIDCLNGVIEREGKG
jgi:hypothetical protein